MKIYVFFLLLLLMSVKTLAQKTAIDSLENRLKTSREDTHKVLILNDLALKYLGFDAPKTKQYLDEGLKLTRKLHFAKGETLLLNVLGEYYHRQGYYAKGIEYVTQSLQIAEKIKDELNIANAYFMLGIIYTDGLKQYDLAIQNGLKGLPIYERTQNQAGIVNMYNLLAWDYAITKQKMTIAREYNEKSILMSQTIKDEKLLAYCIGTKALLFDQENKLDSALFYFQQANQILEKVKDKVVIAYNDIFIGNIYIRQEKYASALSTFQEAVKTSQEVNAREFLKSAYAGLAKVYVWQKQYDKAYQYQELYTQLKDSLDNWETNQKITLIQNTYEKEKQQVQINLLEKEKKIALEETRIYFLAFLGGILSFLVILSLIIYHNRQQKRANMLLQEKNEEIALQAEELQVSNEEVMAQRDSLDEKVQERTQTLEIAHEKLRSYAFSNSHKVRRPVATILGLLYLFNKQNLNESFNLHLLEMLQKTAQELDEVTREINRNLEDLEEEEER